MYNYNLLFYIILDFKCFTLILNYPGKFMIIGPYISVVLCNESMTYLPC